MYPKAKNCFVGNLIFSVGEVEKKQNTEPLIIFYYLKFCYSFPIARTINRRIIAKKFYPTSSY